MAPDRGPSWGIVINGLTLLIALFTAAIVFGEMRGQVARNRDDIQQLQKDSRRTDEKLNDIRGDVRDIKARLEILLPSSAFQQQETARNEH